MRGQCAFRVRESVLPPPSISIVPLEGYKQEVRKAKRISAIHNSRCHSELFNTDASRNRPVEHRRRAHGTFSQEEPIRSCSMAPRFAQPTRLHALAAAALHCEGATA